MASKCKFRLNVGVIYFLELKDRLVLTTRSEQNPVRPGDKELIHICVQPDHILSKTIGHGMFFVEVDYPRGNHYVFAQRFPMSQLPGQDIYEESIVSALVPIDLGPTFATFEIEIVPTF